MHSNDVQLISHCKIHKTNKTRKAINNLIYIKTLNHPDLINRLNASKLKTIN